MGGGNLREPQLETIWYLELSSDAIAVCGRALTVVYVVLSSEIKPLSTDNDWVKLLLSVRIENVVKGFYIC